MGIDRSTDFPDIGLVELDDDEVAATTVAAGVTFDHVHDLRGELRIDP